VPTNKDLTPNPLKITGTLITFDHTGFPATERDHLASGWYANYWEPMKKYLERA
jgi:hypothetical protein